MSLRVELAVAVLGLGLGAGLGWRPPHPLPSAPPAPLKRAVCTRVSSTLEAPDCEDALVRRDFCAARLAAASRPRPTTAPPEAVGVDDPREWKAKLDAMLATCGSSAAVEQTDCAEYPCVSALGLDAAAAEALGHCFDQQVEGKEWTALLPMPVDCGGGELRTMWMFAVVDQDTVDELYPKAAGQFIPEELVLLAARRSDALAAQWGCGR